MRRQISNIKIFSLFSDLYIQVVVLEMDKYSGEKEIT
ncbi:hypothetical protein LCGC14_1457320 [marine sediment metagenome]|uniref:Uncharacterized protein n=1 Tax=marine sediment metagenome TaxID=412755 RepID=A0A0F9JG48_9ZZZZ